ncbi:hypothetical protein OE430_11165 [Pseudomonas aeruginosa]|nr:hypothetical protein [Pseudomonas aeruginosa]
MTESKICTCPSGDGSLRHPCPAHPAVEQAGGDEHEPLPYWEPCNLGCDPEFNGKRSRHCAQLCHGARAALAQPSPALPPFAEKVLAKLRRFYDCASDFESGGVDIGRHWLDLLTQLGLLNRVQRSPALWEISQQGEDLLGMPQPSPAQAEAARLREENANLILTCASLDSEKREMQHKWDAIIAERDAALTRVAELEQKSAGSWTVDTSCGRPILMYEGCSVIEDQTAYEVIRMIKWIGELERQKPVATVAKVPGEDWNSLDFHRDLQDMQPGTKLYAAPVAQAQQLHDLDKQCRDDVARALGLRPNQERGFAWSYLLASIKSCVKASGDSAQAQHSVPDGAADLCRFLAKLYCELDGLRYSTAKLPAEQIADALIFKWPVLQGARNQLNIKRISEQPYDESKLHSAIAAMLAAAPGKEVGHE